MGPHPYPWMVREFHRVIGDEAREQCRDADRRRPRRRRRLRRRRLERHRALLRLRRRPTPGWSASSPPVAPPSAAACPASCTACAATSCRTSTARCEEAQSISAGLDYPASGPSTRTWRSIGRAEYPAVTDAEVLDAFQLLARTEGIIAAFESAHARGLGRSARPPRSQGADGVGQPVGPRRQGRRPDDGRLLGDDRHGVGSTSTSGPKRADGRKLLVPYITGGYPGWQDAVRAAAANGADAVEIGIPFSDPVMDGPVIQQASQAALEAGATPLSILDAVADARRRRSRWR